jgi:tetratricopeptide (TPR) repeat protein
MPGASFHRCQVWLLVAMLAVCATTGAARAQQPEKPPALLPDSAGEEPPATLADMPWIQGQTLEERQRARQIFLEANLLLEDTLFARAAARYEQALAIWPHPSFSYNLALARIHLGQSIEAHESMSQAVRYGSAPLGEDLYKNAQSFLALLGNQLAEIEVACDEPGATVTLDGKPLLVGPGRRTLMALPGGHVLMATKNGHLPDTEEIVLAPGQRARFALAPEVPDQLVTERPWPGWKPWAVVGAGAVVVAAGGYLDWRAVAAFDRFDADLAEACTGTSGCEAADVSASLYGQRDRAETLQWSARATYLVGGTALAAGAVLLYLNRERPVRRGGHGASVDVSLVPVLALQAAAVSARWYF